MPSWLNLTSISAAVTVAAFIAEFLKAFPSHPELRRSFLLMSGGFFLGSILTAASGIRLSVAGSDSPFALLMAICASGAAVFLLAAVLAQVSAKKAEYYLVVGGLVAAFLGLLFINAIYMSDTNSYVGVGHDLTFSEKLLLADTADRKGDWDRSAYMLESALSGLNDSDPRAKALNERIAKVKELDLNSDLFILNKADRLK